MRLRKGVQYLLQAFSELSLENAELMLLGSMEKEMEPLFEKYKGLFKHMGHIPFEKLYDYYSQGSIFVLPSVEEGLALVQPQAMACGLPVICTTNTGGEDIIRNGKEGFIVPIRDVEALKEKILYLYDHPKAREKMSHAAKKRVEKGYTWDDYGDRMIKEYNRILKKHR
jgi:glycosyltransferase involved in cell wall biosynthesis